MLSYFCEERTTEFCKVINDSANYRILDNITVCFIVPLIFYLLFNLTLELRNANFKSWSKIKLVKAVFDKLGTLYLFVFVAYLAYVAFAYLATFYSRHVGDGFSTDPAVWGQAGDFFGGILNPILAFCSFMALLFTVRLQIYGMKEARAARAQNEQAINDQLRAMAPQQAQDTIFKSIQDGLFNGSADPLTIAHNHQKISLFSSHVNSSELTELNLDVALKQLYAMGCIAERQIWQIESLLIYLNDADISESIKVFIFRTIISSSSDIVLFALALKYNVITCSVSAQSEKVYEILKDQKFFEYAPRAEASTYLLSPDRHRGKSDFCVSLYQLGY
jgi:hypothetical protein